jgi:hypothetical protein
LPPAGCCRDFFHTGACKYEHCKFDHIRPQQAGSIVLVLFRHIKCTCRSNAQHQSQPYPPLLLLLLLFSSWMTTHQQQAQWNSLSLVSTCSRNLHGHPSARRHNQSMVSFR